MALPPYPILEYDPQPEAIIEPSKTVRPIAAPEHCVVCFFQEVLTDLESSGQARVIAQQHWADMSRPLYEISYRGQRFAAIHPGVGAPLAVGILEEIIARGCRKFIACGGCGVLDGEIAVGHLIIPTAAIRDEGTSYHYLPPGRAAHPTPAALQAIESTLQEEHLPYRLGKTWTTDAPYRETAEKVRNRKAEGCLSVEMEAAAFFALAQFRSVEFGQILYGGDDVSGDKDWDERGWHQQYSVRQRLFWLAAQACLKL